MSKSTEVRTRTRKKQTEGTITKSMEFRERGVVLSSSKSTEQFSGADHPTPAYVGIEISFTKNLDNFESLRVAVRIDVPCKPNEADLKKDFDKVNGLAEELHSILTDNARATIVGK